jgi:hypothetical protein
MQCGYLASTTLVSATCPLFVDMITTALLRFDVIHYTSQAPSQLANRLTVGRRTVNPRLSRYP